MDKVESAREVCGSMRKWGKNPKSICWNDEVKSVVRRKEAAWKEVLAASDEEAKERYMEVYREEKIKLNRCIYQSKKKVNEQFGRNINEDVNRKLFWKEVINAKGGKKNSFNRMKDGNGRFVQGGDQVRMIWKEYFEVF